MQHSADDIATKHSVKRISALNEHEGQFLRRRLNTYKKIHDKELNDVVNHLEEIRETMKSFCVDPTYGTHALPSTSSGKPRNVRQASAKGKLRRTQSYPEVKLADEPHNSFPLISGKDPKHVRTLGLSMQSSNAATSSEVGKGAGWVHEARRKLAGKPSGGSLAMELSTQQLHRKVERSKTAPISMLQPLLKTTPEMMKKKIHLSTSPRQQYRQRPPSPPRGDAAGDSTDSSFEFSLVETRSSASARWRPTPSSLQLNPNGHAEFPGRNKKGRSTNSSVDEPINQAKNSKDAKIPAHAARGVRSTASGTRQNRHTRIMEEQRSANEMSRSNAAKGIDEHESSRSITKDLKQCRYLQFVKDRPGNNFI